MSYVLAVQPTTRKKKNRKKCGFMHAPRHLERTALRRERQSASGRQGGFPFYAFYSNELISSGQVLARFT
jgi:hypothetical protein